MHHKTKESAINRHGHLASKSVDLVQALKADENNFTDEEVQMLFDAITKPKEAGPAIKTDRTFPESESTKGKKHYDIYWGQWFPLEKITNPFDGKEIVLKWEFRREGAARKTGVPMEPEKAREFNEGKRLRSAKSHTEQMFEVGDDSPIYDILPNPFQSLKVNQ